jgi:histone H3/H4
MASKRLGRKLKKDTSSLLTQRAPFVRMVKAALSDLKITYAGKDGKRKPFRMTRKAILALHAAAENWGVGIFEKAAILAMNAKRETVMAQDVKTSLRFCK